MARGLAAPLLLSAACAAGALCAGDPSAGDPSAGDPAADRARLLAVAADPAAWAGCAEIADPRMSVECRMVAALALAGAGGEAAAAPVCAGLPAGPTADECRFLVCDGARVRGADARRCCAGAGAFQTRCLGHARGRDAQAAWDAAPAGREDLALEAVIAAFAAAMGPEAGAERGRRFAVDALAARAGEAGLSLEVCGRAPAELCAEVYVELVRRSGAPPRPACGRSVSAARATGLGLPGWTPDVEAAAAAAWRGLCRR